MMLSEVRVLPEPGLRHFVDALLRQGTQSVSEAACNGMEEEYDASV